MRHLYNYYCVSMSQIINIIIECEAWKMFCYCMYKLELCNDDLYWHLQTVYSNDFRARLHWYSISRTTNVVTWIFHQLSRQSMEQGRGILWCRRPFIKIKFKVASRVWDFNDKLEGIVWNGVCSSNKSLQIWNDPTSE